ncbi:MAG TPA: formyltransferase family protein [Flavitalea sp.]|nr:formyltransferase family protein [Flavitalea sp.]
MKIAVICNTDSLALPVLNFLHKKGLLLEVGILEKNAAVLLGAIQQIGIDKSRIQLFSNTGWKETLQTWLERLKPDMTWVFAFPWRIPPFILSIPSKGFFNFHFGSLPKYKGADPVFWQLKNIEAKSDLTIHLMTEQIDEGPVMLTHEIPIVPGENYGMLCSRMGGMAVGAVENFLNQYQNNTLTSQSRGADESLFYHKPGEVELSINWKEQTAAEIEWLVNATNPKYGGASARIRNMEVRFLEVTPANIENAPDTEPGTIVYADALYGLIVACRNREFLKINIVQMSEGYFSGTKLFNMGIHQGEQFT